MKWSLMDRNGKYLGREIVYVSEREIVYVSEYESE